ncbi:MAG: sortase [Lachnospiraceae bacterium]|nr:sortase [Lachnospiraceae bacterium]
MKRRKKGRILTAAGLLLIAAALCLTAFNLYEDRQAGVQRDAVLAELRAAVPQLMAQAEAQTGAQSETAGNGQAQTASSGLTAHAGGTSSAGVAGAEGGPSGAGSGSENGYAETVYPDYVLDPGMEMPVKTIGEYDYLAVLSIPSIGLEYPVMDTWDMKRLKVNPCRYSGTAYRGNMVICAHNTRSHFEGLKRLSIGDAVSLTDMDGNVFRYRVGEITVLQPTDVEEMTESGWDLTLFTCTLRGQARLTVRCEKLKDAGSAPAR